VKRTLPLFIACVSLVCSIDAADFSLQETADTITIMGPAAPVLTYHKAEMSPPEGETELYRRSGFIHPLHAPNGDVVTSIHAPDHLHHMGVWHAWVRTKWNGRELDFWNVAAGEGTVRFVDVLDREFAADAVGFTVRQQQVALAADDLPEVVILAEEFAVLARQEGDAHVIDYTVTQTNVTDHALEMPAYRYGGGIAFRAPAAWGEDNDAYVTSTGLDRTEGHAKRADWVIMHGPTESGESSVVIMGHPENHDAPQRMRIWREGKVFFNFVPAQEFDWKIAPGETITLRYRLLVFGEAVGAPEVDPYWKRYGGE
jgi:hypothetical protein